DSDRMPLRSRLLAIPELRERYMKYIHQIAEQSLDWERLKPSIDRYRELISPIVKADTKMLDTYEAFLATTGTDQSSNERMSLRQFAEQRSEFLLKSH
ncbi:MAG: CotH kinase family protein, partial [Planctomycetales bacterium]|nr:CotH kinase family protein [Planctomycetales bacterium]